MRSLILLLALSAPFAMAAEPAVAAAPAVQSIAAASAPAASAAALSAPKRLAQQTGSGGQALAYLGVIAGCSIVISLLVAGLIKLVAMTMNRTKKA